MTGALTGHWTHHPWRDPQSNFIVIGCDTDRLGTELHLEGFGDNSSSCTLILFKRIRENLQLPKSNVYQLTKMFKEQSVKLFGSVADRWGD